MDLTIISTDYDLFNQLVEEITIMMPIYPYSKPVIYNVNWRECEMKLFADGDYYHIFTSALKRFIIDKKIRIKMNLPFFPLAVYDENRVPNDNWLVNI